MRYLQIILVVFLCFNGYIRATVNTDFEKRDAYYIINDFEYIISEDTVYNFTEKDFPDTTLDLDPSLDLTIRFERPDTFKMSIPQGHFYAKRYVKLKVNTNKGVENWAYYLLSSDFFSNVQYLNIKVIKPEGKVLDVDKNLFLNKAWFFKNENKADTFRFNVEGISPGDVIEVAYFSEYSKSNYFKMNGKLSFASNLTSLKTIYRYTIPQYYKMFYKLYNGLKPPVTSFDSITNKRTIEFSADSIEMIDDLNYVSLINEFPYLYYYINISDIKKADLLNIYNDFFNMANPPFSSLEQDIRWIKQNLESYKIEDKYLKFKFIYNTLYKNFDNSSNLLALGYTGSITKNELFKFYVHLLSFLKIDFYLGIALDKYSGDIDLETLKLDDLHFMLMYYDNDSNRNFIYPHSDKIKYYVNEFPGKLNGSKAIFMKQIPRKKKIKNYGNLKDTSDLEIKHITLRGGDNNNIKLQRTVHINPENSKSFITSAIEYSGFCSETRHLIQLYLKNKNAVKMSSLQIKSIKIDSIFNPIEENNYPFLYSYKTFSNVENLCNHLDDSTISISLNKLIVYDLLKFRNNRTTNIVLPYSYCDIYNYTFEFPRQIKLLNGESLNCEIDNQYGRFSCEFKQTENNKILMKTSYAVKNEFIPVDSFKNLIEINNAADLVMNTMLVIRIK